MTEAYLCTSIAHYGLSDGLSRDLQRALHAAGCEFPRVPTGRSRDAIKSLIFCAPEVSAIQRLRGKHPDALIIAAGQSADADEWLDAIQAGADDYCAAPFNPAQLRWILHSNLFADRMAA